MMNFWLRFAPWSAAAAAAWFLASAPSPAEPVGRALYFEPNRGQFEAGAAVLDHPRWRAVFDAGRVTAAAKRVVRDPGPSLARRVRSARARPLGVEMFFPAPVAPRPEAPGRGRSNYFWGTGPEDWMLDVPHFGRVRYAAIEPGVDAVFSAAEGLLECRFEVRDAAGARAIRWTLGGAGEVRAGSRGLRVEAPWATLSIPLPVIAATGRPAAGAYVVAADGQARFEPR